MRNPYRMSQLQMISLKSSSTHWRATCSFPVDGIDGRDQARGNFVDFDIMTFVGSGQCEKMDYIDVRGKLRCIKDILSSSKLPCGCIFYTRLRERYGNRTGLIDLRKHSCRNKTIDSKFDYMKINDNCYYLSRAYICFDTFSVLKGR